MSVYLATVIWIDPYEKKITERIEASSFATASGRAIRAWRAQTKGKHIKDIKITITKLT